MNSNHNLPILELNRNQNKYNAVPINITLINKKNLEILNLTRKKLCDRKIQLLKKEKLQNINQIKDL